MSDGVDMSTVRELHRQAMEHYDSALLAQRNGECEAEFASLTRAFDLEREAAQAMMLRWDIEPTRSILFRGAATIALRLHRHREAEQLASLGLAGTPPDDLADEIRDLLEEINLERHLELRGETLLADEMQFSLAGPAVGFGAIEIDEFIERTEAAKKVTLRTIARKQNLPFHETGRPPKTVTEGNSIFLTSSRAASFAVTMRLTSNTGQRQIDSIGVHSEVFEELFTCFDMLQKQDIESLRNHIGNEAYFTNFLALAKRIAPDGERVSEVGLTLTRNGNPRKLAFTARRDSLPSSTFSSTSSSTTDIEPVEIKGKLQFADALVGHPLTIKIVDQTGVKHSIFVPEGMMNDIVKPLWNEEVTVRGSRRGKNIRLEEISKSNE